MYQIHCGECGTIDTYPRRVAAESRAEAHVESTGHECLVEDVADP